MSSGCGAATQPDEMSDRALCILQMRLTDPVSIMNSPVAERQVVPMIAASNGGLRHHHLAISPVRMAIMWRFCYICR